MTQVKAGKRFDGLWGQALARAKGDEQVAKAVYIKLRAESVIRDTEANERRARQKPELSNTSNQTFGCATSD